MALMTDGAEALVQLPIPRQAPSSCHLFEARQYHRGSREAQLHMTRVSVTPLKRGNRLTAAPEIGASPVTVAHSRRMDQMSVARLRRAAPPSTRQGQKVAPICERMERDCLSHGSQTQGTRRRPRLAVTRQFAQQYPHCSHIQGRFTFTLHIPSRNKERNQTHQTYNTDKRNGINCKRTDAMNKPQNHQLCTDVKTRFS